MTHRIIADVPMDHRLFFEQDFALLNPMQLAPECYADLPVVPLLPPGLERHQRLMPLLLWLGGLSAEIRLELMDRSSRWLRKHGVPFFSVLMLGKVSPNVAKARLTRNMILHRDKGTKTWLRYHDPRVLRHLCWLLDADELQALTGFMETCTWYDPEIRQWQMISSGEHDSSLFRRTRLSFSATRWREIDQIELLNRTLRDLANEAFPVEGAARELLAAILQADAVGLRDPDDVMLFARQRYFNGPRWLTEPMVIACIDQVRRGEVTYFSACTAAGLMAAAPGAWGSIHFQGKEG